MVLALVPRFNQLQKYGLIYKYYLYFTLKIFNFVIKKIIFFVYHIIHI